jgi:hypothetical protein
LLRPSLFQIVPQIKQRLEYKWQRVAKREDGERVHSPERCEPLAGGQLLFPVIGSGREDVVNEGYPLSARITLLEAGRESQTQGIPVHRI